MASLMDVLEQAVKIGPFRVATKEETEKFKPIQGLVPGMALKLVRPCSVKRPKLGEVVYVCRTMDGIMPMPKDASRVCNYDFTALMVDTGDDEIIEYPFESRYFEKVQ